MPHSEPKREATRVTHGGHDPSVAHDEPPGRGGVVPVSDAAQRAHSGSHAPPKRDFHFATTHCYGGAESPSH